MKVGQIYDYPVDQVITRQDYASLDGLSQVTALTKDQITRVQKELLRLGYPIGTADGIVGAKTKAATRIVQTRAKLTVDGVPSSKLLQVLESGDQKLLAASDADKKAVAAAVATTVPTTASLPTPTIPVATSTAVVPAAPPTAPAATEPGAAPEESVMTKLTDYVKQNPYVVGGVAVAIAASAWWYWSRRSVSAAAPVMAGMDDFGSWEMPPPKRKKRRKSRKSKK